MNGILAAGGRFEASDGAVSTDALQQTRHFRTAVETRERQPERMEEFAALPASALLQFGRERLPRLLIPVQRPRGGGGFPHEQPFFVTELRGLDVAIDDRKPAVEVGKTFEVRSQQTTE